MPSPSTALDTPAERLGGVGESTRAHLERLGLRTVRDLIRHYPARYDDLRSIARIADIGPSSTPETNVAGIITQFKHVRLRGRVRSKSTATIEDGSGSLLAVWFGRPYLANQLKPGMRVLVRGRVERTLAGPSMSVGMHRALSDDDAYHGELVPVYPLTAGLANRTLRRVIAKALEAAARSAKSADLDALPPAVAAKEKFGAALPALRSIHAPSSVEEAERARARVVFEEFFVLAASTALRRAALQSEPSPDFSALRSPAAMRAAREAVEAMFPFRLTAAQRRIIDEVERDMTRGAPMNRLLQGDVGSGKTAVAAAAALFAARAGFQTAFMAPTEILATQQFRKLGEALGPAGVNVALLVGGTKPQTRARILEELADGRIDVVVGTHALIVEDVSFASLGLAVIDEQHRFGVLQRAALRAKARGHTPHTLVMTATPIPRTLAQSVYADLDVSILDELPPGRQPVKTYVRAVSAKPKIFAFVREQVALGRQAYVVCPAIEESERAIASAEKEAERLRAEEFTGLRVALLHGRLSAAHKDEIMRLFADGFINVLISTSVVEVGVDVPNATVMVVLDAHAFGLAQLHQLRGRVGRGSARSFCILVAPVNANESKRLAVLEKTTDGFVIAEEDLKIRGAGDLAGLRQHGGAEFKLADLVRDFPTFVRAKQAATEVVAADPHLASAANAGLAARLAALDREAAIRSSS